MSTFYNNDSASSDRSSDCVVDVRALTKVFDAQRSLFNFGRPRSLHIAVDHIDLQIHEGQILGLVGPNGAGKTTLIKMLTTLLVPSSGSASIMGHDIVQEEKAVRRLVGLVTSNERSFYWRLTGRQNLEFFADLYHLPKRTARGWIDQLLEMVNLDDKADERFDSYSTGMKQRMALARGLLSKPKVLFMDEPTKGVDPIGAAQIVDLILGPILELWKPTILITSHNLSEIERLCKSIAVLDHGRIVARGGLDELRRLAGAVDRYELTIANIEPSHLEDMTRRCDPISQPSIAQLNGHSKVSVEFERGADHFPALIRSVVTAGGDVVNCTSVEASFDEVFHVLVQRSNERGGESA